MKTVYNYYKNSNTGELLKSQTFTETAIKGMPINFYDVNGKKVGENLKLDGFVPISQKKFEIIIKKSK
jgi:hypothetical protein